MEQANCVEKQYPSRQGSWIFSMLSKVLDSMRVFNLIDHFVILKASKVTQPIVPFQANLTVKTDTLCTRFRTYIPNTNNIIIQYHRQAQKAYENSLHRNTSYRHFDYPNYDMTKLVKYVSQIHPPRVHRLGSVMKCIWERIFSVQKYHFLCELLSYVFALKTNASLSGGICFCDKLQCTEFLFILQA